MASDALNRSSHLTIKGTRYYSADKLFKRKSLKPGDAVNLIHDEGNRFDPWAIEVIHARSNSKLGYLSQGVAKKYYQLLKQKKVVSSEISQVRLHNGELLISVAISATYQPPVLPSIITDTENISAVYLIINNSCKRVYVGSSRQVRDRLRTHFTDLSHGWHQNDLLQSDYQSSKLTDFQSVIIPVDDDKAKREQVESEQITSLLARNVHLYNMTKDGKGVKAYTDYEGLVSISDVMLGLQEDDDGEHFHAFVQDYLISFPHESPSAISSYKGQKDASLLNEAQHPTSHREPLPEPLINLFCPKCKRVSRAARSTKVCPSCRRRIF